VRLALVFVSLLRAATPRTCRHRWSRRCDCATRSRADGRAAARARSALATYWINPGTGYATKLDWKLPAGWTAGEIQWPAPSILRDHTGAVVGNGYNDEILLPVTLTPPADLKRGEKVELNASASGSCARTFASPATPRFRSRSTCPPMRRSPTRVGRENPRDRRRSSASGRRVESLRVAGGENDHAHGHAHARRRPLARPLNDLHFFADDNLVAYELRKS